VAKNPKRWFLLVLGLPAVLLAGAHLVGWFLPEDYRAVSRIELNAPVDSVWAVVADFENYPAWRPDVERIASVDSDGETLWEEQPLRIAYLVREIEPPHRLVTEFSPELTFTGLRIYEIRETGSGSAVTLTETGAIDNALFRFLTHLLFGPHSGIDSYLSALGDRFGGADAPVHLGED
jgi:hypothetical protein